MEDVAVSVIVPVYNVEKYLDECLLHLEQQTLKEIEVILVNDGSTDSSSEIAQRYADKNSNFKLINRENGGLSAARNTGIECAKGKYLYFMDSDDYLADTALDELFKIAEQNSLDVLKFSAYTFEDDSSDFEWGRYKYSGSYETIYQGTKLLNEVLNNEDDIMSCCLIFIRRKLVEEYDLKFYEGIIHEDHLFHWSLLALSQRVMIINKPLYYRRYRSGSIMQAVDYYQSFRGFVVTVKKSDEFLNTYPFLKETEIDRYIYNFLKMAHIYYPSLTKKQKLQKEYHYLLKVDRKFSLKYRKFDKIAMVFFSIHPKIGCLYVDLRARVERTFHRTKGA